MLSFDLDRIETYTRPLCTDEAYATKLENYELVKRSFAARSERPQGLPLDLSVEPSGSCDMQCRGCPRGSGRIERSGQLPYARFREVFEPLGPTLCNVFVSGFGEPLMNEATPRMIALASRYSVASVLNTNGTLLLDRVDALLDSGLCRINVALDGRLERSYHTYRSEEHFARVVRGVERLAAEKARRGLVRPEIEGQFLMSASCDEDPRELERWARSLGVERTKFKRPYTTIAGEGRRPMRSIEEYGLAVRLGELSSTEASCWTPAQCSSPWDTLLLTCDGELGICTYDPQLRLALTDGASAGAPVDVLSVWSGARARQIRRWLVGRGEDGHSPCSLCNRMPGYLFFDRAPTS